MMPKHDDRGVDQSGFIQQHLITVSSVLQSEIFYLDVFTVTTAEQIKKRPSACLVCFIRIAKTPGKRQS